MPCLPHVSFTLRNTRTGAGTRRPQILNPKPQTLAQVPALVDDIQKILYSTADDAAPAPAADVAPVEAPVVPEPVAVAAT